MKRKARLLITFTLLSALSQTSGFAQGEQKPAGNFRVYDSSGKVVTLDDVVDAMSGAEVVLIGESHNDRVAHEIESELLQRAAARYSLNGGASTARQVILSMEMFERDVQTTLDEYLGGLILERQFISDSRPWSNYQSDYRPLIEFARSNKLPVIAANAPGRYANRASRMGRGSLLTLSQQAKAWLAPLPYGEASAAYAAKFNRVMEGMPAGHQMNKQYLLDAQVLRDATMAHAIAQNLNTVKKALVLHVTGIFHVEGRMGVPEQLEAYRPRTRAIVVALIPAAEAPAINPESLKRIGDFVIVTGAAGQ